MAETSLTPRDALAELGRIRLDEVDVDGVLGRVAHLARGSVPGAAEVSVTLLRGSVAESVAYTGDLALRLDEKQYADNRGPCLDASATADAVIVPDTSREDRWPDWAGCAHEAGVGSSLSIGLPIQEAVVGTLNVYGLTPHAFDADSVELTRSFAAFAAVALANAHAYGNAATLAEQMRAALEKRAVIEQAKGIIMGRRRCGPDEAFAVLARLAQETDGKLRDVAAAMVARAVDPGR